ncbi:hypothetical protein [Metabacillus malikii]|uniref:Uncharacterized protein n=1 Tax=Metabacillus malikii TaxID=1504265 RepID=A0ABT9ZAH4_9BACI|nr:hypothetical protein [Metabacillus malikii]MDQ0229020.1 hypothetical protein [Metabacillus malikii]
MKEILEQAIKNVEKAYENPNTASLDDTIKQLQQAKEQYGDKGTMIEDAINSLIHAQHSIAHMETAKDFSPSAAFGQAHNALEQAINSYVNVDNDPM